MKNMNIIHCGIKYKFVLDNEKILDGYVLLEDYLNMFRFEDVVFELDLFVKTNIPNYKFSDRKIEIPKKLKLILLRTAYIRKIYYGITEGEILFTIGKIPEVDLNIIAICSNKDKFDEKIGELIVIKRMQKLFNKINAFDIHCATNFIVEKK